MQFSDPDRHIRADVRRLFDREADRGAWWITGTEAGPASSMAELLEAEATRHGYGFHRWASVWVAWDRTRSSAVRTGHVKVLDSSDGQGAHGDRGIAWASWATEDLGRMVVGAGHYLTQGRRPGDPNYGPNTRMAKAIGAWGRRHGKGTALVFYGGDQNIGDRHLDTFRGEPFTSVWDEVGRWPDTGHGNIDVIASYNRDRRVEAVAAKALPDLVFPLNTDHYLVEASFSVRSL